MAKLLNSSALPELSRVFDGAAPVNLLAAHNERVSYALTLPKGHPLRFMLLYGGKPSLPKED